MDCPHHHLHENKSWATWDVGWTYTLFPASIVHNLHLSVCWHHKWPTSIFRSLQTSVYRCRPMEGTSAKAYKHLVRCYALFGRHLHRPMSGKINKDMCISVKRRWPTIGVISKGVHAFNVVCAHLQGDIGVSQRQKASPKVVCFDKETPVVDFLHHP